jgi:hypothetical protein
VPELLIADARSVRTTAIGSPPKGSSTTIDHPTTTTTKRLKTPTAAWGTKIGSACRRFGTLF